jgi:hypothetical protein
MPAPAVSPNDLTRQQLDELDALLQRMLSLPVGKPAEAAPPPKLPDPPVPDPIPAQPVRIDPPAPAKTPHLTFPPARENPVVVSATVPAATVAEMRSFTPPAPKPFEFPSPDRLFGPPTPDTGVTPPTAVAEPFGPVPIHVPPAVEDDPEPVALVAPVPSAGSSRVPVAHWPLFGVNWMLERMLDLFGPPGQILCSPAAKTVLGWGGVLLLTGAGAWVARGMGWVHFDWPR